MKYVYYLHKETGLYISLEDLKAMKERNSIKLSLYHQQPLAFDWECNRTLTVNKPKHYMYVITEIPFSEDFEVVCFDEEDFNLKDLEILHSTLKYEYSPTGLVNKVKNKFSTLLEIRNKNSTPDCIRKIIE